MVLSVLGWSFTAVPWRHQFVHEVPHTPGLYLACNARLPNPLLYVGEAENRYERTVRDQTCGNHAGLDRALAMGGDYMLFGSHPVWTKQYRTDMEKIFQFEFAPPANMEPIPSLSAVAAAALRLQRKDLCAAYLRKMIEQRPNNRPANALSGQW